MLRPPPSPSLGRASSGSTWSYGNGPSTSRESSCSSGSCDSLPHTCLSDSDFLPSELKSFSSLSFLLDLQLSAEDMTIDSTTFPCESHQEPTDVDLTLSPPASPQPGYSMMASTTLNPQTDNLMDSNTPQTASNEDGKQPWRKFWPPTPGSPWFQRVASQRPDVLSFSFDPRKHLLHQNHPWQAWTAKQHGEIELDDEDSLEMGELDSAAGDYNLSVQSSIQQVRDELDDLIQVDLQLPSVSPTQFNYLRPLRRYEHERPYRLQLPPGLVPISASNVQTKSYPVRIHDISGHEDKFTLDVSGFEFFKCPVSVGEWNDQAVTESYLPALLDWVVSVLGGDSGLVYSFNFRHHSSDCFVPVQRPWRLPNNPISLRSLHALNDDNNDGVDEDYSIKRFLATDRRDDHFNMIDAVKADPRGPCHWKRPLFRVHCDASDNTHKHRLRIVRPNESEELMKGRVRLVSVWRVLSTYIQDTPLALCDARTVDREDLVPMDIVYPHFTDEVFEVRFNKSHRWFYKKGMEAQDVAIFKLHDTHSKETVCPHSAFVDPDIPSNTPSRASIEVKIMVFGGNMTEDEGTG